MNVWGWVVVQKVGATRREVMIAVAALGAEAILAMAAPARTVKPERNMDVEYGQETLRSSAVRARELIRSSVVRNLTSPHRPLIESSDGTAQA